jgi:hypothetical protein
VIDIAPFVFGIMKSSFILPSLFSFVSTVSAATLTYNWDIGFVNVNPDGRLTRPAIGINVRGTVSSMH